MQNTAYMDLFKFKLCMTMTIKLSAVQADVVRLKIDHTTSLQKKNIIKSMGIEKPYFIVHCVV